MRKPEIVREVYAELKSVYGDTMSSREILECAALMVEATEDSLYEPVIDARGGSIPFTELPVNVVIQNWSWKVVNREIIWEDDFSPQVPQEFLLEQCLLKAA